MGTLCFCLDVRREPSPDSNTNTKSTLYKGEKIKETSDQVKIKVSSMIMSLSMHYLHLQFYSMVFVCQYTRKKHNVQITYKIVKLLRNIIDSNCHV